MTISITLTPDQERKLEAARLARTAGTTLRPMSNIVVTAYLDRVESKKEKTLEEILAPVWEGWQQSGMTEQEIDDLFRQELQEVRRERRPRKETSTTHLQ